MKNKTLYVTDLDGTLLNRDSRVSAFSAETINRLVERGMCFTYATARSLSSASKVTKGLSANIPIIAYNGAFIVQPSTGKALAETYYTLPQREKIRGVLSEYGISPLVYAYIDGIERVTRLSGRENEGIRHYLTSRPGDKRFRAVSDEDRLYEGDVFYFTCIGEKEALALAYAVLSLETDLTCTFQQELYRPEYWFEIMPTTKAEAIVRLKDMLGCERVISFGDAVNDLPMFAVSDECYAVENAAQALKDAADGIIGSNDEDGVAKWLLAHVPQEA